LDLSKEEEGKPFYWKLTNINPLYSLTQLECLNLCGNNIELLSPKIQNLSNLRILRFSNNLLTSIPTEIRSLTKLEMFELDRNQLCTLPHSLLHCTLLNFQAKYNPICDPHLKRAAELGNSIVTIKYLSMSYLSLNMFFCFSDELPRDVYVEIGELLVELFCKEYFPATLSFNFGKFV
jgi:hypothetical protein